ncbi:hypothetical protein OG607_40030 [Streptomyces sp. NBC_01537]|uniref:hypothetical protein n=1 Tax=Streptomyces sp. NBC_01537 TaxID=2903896 RepID=UPI0038696EE9
MSKKTSPAGGTETVVYQSSLHLSRATLTFLGDLLRGHLKKIRSRWRKLPGRENRHDRSCRPAP